MLIFIRGLLTSCGEQKEKTVDDQNDRRHPDARLGKDGNRQVGSLYDLLKNATPVGEWNRVSIIVYRGTIVHIQNVKTVVE
ncbi:family 16 glycoside hydrolase [Zunongwangia sp. F260]|uniref:Family 16 glycoside hydrolase n=1 Tax=Autumnicola lenta TaxID=3075593 RepID=A0ABU3CNR3_9FLAO|nr:family 16 glycoside hydrolase [Zunongwangia sp. F260]MDT0647992.1 family 16 glycoside hydrolase [Zunongwangia sp. F260]